MAEGIFRSPDDPVSSSINLCAISERAEQTESMCPVMTERRLPPKGGGRTHLSPSRNTSMCAPLFAMSCFTLLPCFPMITGAASAGTISLIVA